jgi:alpha-glucosidase
LFFADPADSSLRAEDHAFLLGGDVLVQPQLLEHGSHDFQTPKGKWRTFSLDEDPAPDSLPRLSLRAGGIVPVGAGGQTTEEAFAGPLTLLVSLDDSGRAAGRLYEDAGEGFGYLDGDFLLTTYRAVLNDGMVEVSIGRQEGGRARPVRALHVEIFTDSGVLHATGTDGETLTVALHE